MTTDWPKQFDLNMEEDLLEAWGPSDGIRELVANALDEQVLTNTDPVDIEKDQVGCWHIRDYGRGLQYKHFTQGEDEEKLENPDTVIGKFGVGLKDALAVLYRHGVEVTIHSAHNTFTVEEASKAEFDDVTTLHAIVDQPTDPQMTGTDVVLEKCRDDAIETAKQNFLRFSDETRLETTPFGDVYLAPTDQPATIYVTGLRVAEEEDFLFSYNITNTTKKIRDALNRERANVGRSAYSTRVKRILQECESGDVAGRLVDDLEKFQEGRMHDELSWKSTQIHAVKVMNSKKDVVVATAQEQFENRDLVDNARQDGYDVVTVPDSIRDDLKEVDDIDGETIRDMGEYAIEYDESFQYDWVDESELTAEENAVWRLHHELLDVIQVPPLVEDIRISETMRITAGEDWKTQGTWNRQDGLIVIKRDLLNDPVQFLGILLHEIAHPKSGNALDQTRRFERALTDLLGEVGYQAIQSNSQ